MQTNLDFTETDIKKQNMNHGNLDINHFENVRAYNNTANQYDFSGIDVFSNGNNNNKTSSNKAHTNRI